MNKKRGGVIMAGRNSDLIGRKIIAIRPMTDKESAVEGWASVVVELNDGTKLYPSRDAEGNGAGVMFGMDSKGKAFMLL